MNILTACSEQFSIVDVFYTIGTHTCTCTCTDRKYIKPHKTTYQTRGPCAVYTEDIHIWESVQLNRACEVLILSLYKIACYSKQHIFATVQPFPVKFRTFVSTSSVYVRVHFEALIIFHGVSAKIANTTR